MGAYGKIGLIDFSRGAKVRERVFHFMSARCNVGARPYQLFLDQAASMDNKEIYAADCRQ